MKQLHSLLLLCIAVVMVSLLVTADGICPPGQKVGGWERRSVDADKCSDREPACREPVSLEYEYYFEVFVIGHISCECAKCVSCAALSCNVLDIINSLHQNA